MKKTLFLVALLLALPSATLAATYQYVNAGGEVRNVTAASFTEAFALAVNIAPHSGMSVYTGTLVQGDPITANAPVEASTQLAGFSYEYVNVNGQVKIIMAVNEQEAFLLAKDIAPHSGVVSVIAADGFIPSTATVQL